MRSDFFTTIVVIVLIAGAAWLLVHNRNSSSDSYYEPRPDYFDTHPAQLPDDWPGWDARVDVFVHHMTNRPGCDAIETGWLTWRDRLPVVMMMGENGKRITVRTDFLKSVDDFSRVPIIELPYDRGVDIKVSTRLQRSQYLVNWVHKYGFRFSPNIPNAWRDYYQALKREPGATVIIPQPGHTMRECWTKPEEIECTHGGNNRRCDPERYSKIGQFLYPEWATDFPASASLTLVKTKRQAAKPIPESTPEPTPTPAPERWPAG